MFELAGFIVRVAASHSRQKKNPCREETNRGEVNNILVKEILHETESKTQGI